MSLIPSLGFLKEEYKDWGTSFDLKYTLDPTKPGNFYEIFWEKFRAKLKIAKRDEFIAMMKKKIYPVIPVRSGYLMDVIMQSLTYAAVITSFDKVEIFIRYKVPPLYRPNPFYRKVAHNGQLGWGRLYEPVTPEARRARKLLKTSLNRRWGQYLLVDAVAHKDYEGEILYQIADCMINDILMKVLNEMKIEVKVKTKK